MASTIAAGTTSGTALAMAGDTSGSLQLQTNGTTTAVTLDTSQNATFAGKVTSAGALTLASNGTTTAVTIDTSQNVGIGTTSPNFGGNSIALAVNGATSSAVNLKVADVGALTCSSGGTYTSIWEPRNVYMAFGTNATERMRIDPSGNVGIGTSSPSKKLQVAGTTDQLSLTTGTNELIVRASSSEAALYTFQAIPLNFYTNNTERMRIDTSGNVGIGTSSPSYKLHVNTDSAGKPGVGGLWTVVSDARIKSNIVNANLDRCYEIVKSVPLKHFGFAPGVYTDEQIQDKHNLGWIAQDVQKVFKNAVSVKPFTLKTDIPDGTEDYEEQDFTLEIVEKTETSIQVINGKPVQVSKVVTSENKVMLFDTVDVLDEAGDAVMDGDKPLTYQMPRMITKTRPKVRREVIEDCLDLNGGQMQAALYGAVQSLMEKIETLTTRITALEAK